MIDYIVAALITAVTAIGIYLLNERYSRDKVAIPFKEAMDLHKLPLVTFENNGNKLHFLLDTGSNASLIDSGSLEQLEILAKRDINEVMITAGQSVPLSGEILMNITYMDTPFTEKFTVVNLAPQFEEAFGDSIKVHGILGAKFFRRNKYVIDFEKLAVYYKK